jgi:hypothetical protein
VPADKRDPFAFLGSRVSEILGVLAKRDGRTKREELRHLICARAFGQLKDLGDDRAAPLVSEGELSERLDVRTLQVSDVSDTSEGTDD